MSPTIAIRLSCASCGLLAALAFSAPARAADPACKPAFDAMIQLAATPNHQTMTRTAASSAGLTGGEVITTPTAMYIKVAGAWHRSDYNPQQQAAEIRQDAQAKQTSCKYLRDESVGGEATAVYDTQDKQDDGTIVHSQLWISRTRGLPLRQTIDTDVGGKAGKSHTEMNFDYANVQPPAGAP